MNQLENDDPITWNALKEGNFCVKKSDSSLHCTVCRSSSWAEDQGVERLVILWAFHKTRSHLIVLSSHCTSNVNDWLCRFPSSQLPPTLQVSIINWSMKLRDSIQFHCEGNAFIVGTPLKSIVSSVVIWKLRRRTYSAGMRRDWMAIESLFRNVLYLMHPCLCGAQWRRWSSRHSAPRWRRHWWVIIISEKRYNSFPTSLWSNNHAQS